MGVKEQNLKINVRIIPWGWRGNGSVKGNKT